MPVATALAATAALLLTACGGGDDGKVNKPVCAPLGYAMSQFPVGGPQDSFVGVAEQKEFSGAFTYITLATYAPGEAQNAMADMTKAVSACTGGFTAKGGQGLQCVRVTRVRDHRGSTHVRRR